MSDVTGDASTSPKSLRQATASNLMFYLPPPEKPSSKVSPLEDSTVEGGILGK